MSKYEFGIGHFLTRRGFKARVIGIVPHPTCDKYILVGYCIAGNDEWTSATWTIYGKLGNDGVETEYDLMTPDDVAYRVVACEGHNTIDRDEYASCFTSDCHDCRIEKITRSDGIVVSVELESNINPTCVCGGTIGDPNVDCERCQMVAEIERLREEIDQLETIISMQNKQLGVY